MSTGSKKFSKKVEKVAGVSTGTKARGAQLSNFKRSGKTVLVATPDNANEPKAVKVSKNSQVNKAAKSVVKKAVE